MKRFGMVGALALGALVALSGEGMAKNSGATGGMLIVSCGAVDESSQANVYAFEAIGANGSPIVTDVVTPIAEGTQCTKVLNTLYASSTGCPKGQTWGLSGSPMNVTMDNGSGYAARTFVFTCNRP